MAHLVGGRGNEVWIGMEFYTHYKHNVPNRHRMVAQTTHPHGPVFSSHNFQVALVFAMLFLTVKILPLKFLVVHLGDLVILKDFFWIF